MTRLTIKEANHGFADALHRVGVLRERITLTRHGRPVAVLISVADFEALEHGASKEIDT